MFENLKKILLEDKNKKNLDKILDGLDKNLSSKEKIKLYNKEFILNDVSVNYLIYNLSRIKNNEYRNLDKDTILDIVNHLDFELIQNKNFLDHYFNLLNKNEYREEIDNNKIKILDNDVILNLLNKNLNDNKMHYTRFIKLMLYEFHNKKVNDMKNKSYGLVFSDLNKEIINKLFEKAKYDDIIDMSTYSIYEEKIETQLTTENLLQSLYVLKGTLVRAKENGNWLNSTLKSKNLSDIEEKINSLKEKKILNEEFKDQDTNLVKNNTLKNTFKI